MVWTPESIIEVVKYTAPVALGIVGLARYREYKIYQRMDEAQARHTEQVAGLNSQISDLLSRLRALESQYKTSLPSWTRSGEGVLMSVNDAFVQHILMPAGLTKQDVVGRKFVDIRQFSEKFLHTLDAMDLQAANHQYAVAHGVVIHPNTRQVWTVMKEVVIVDDGNVMFRSTACPESQLPINMNGQV